MRSVLDIYAEERCKTSKVSLKIELPQQYKAVVLEFIKVLRVKESNSGLKRNQAC